MGNFERNAFKLATAGVGAVIVLDIVTNGTSSAAIIKAFTGLVTGFYGSLRTK